MSDKSTSRKPSATVTPLRRPRKCPLCGKPADAHWHPFCSKRCADVDLNRWLSGAYAIPGHPAPDTAPPEEED